MANSDMFPQFNQRIISQLILSLILCSFNLLVCKAFAIKFVETDDWTLWEKTDHSKVSYRKINREHYPHYESSGLIEIKAKTQVESSLAGFILFIEDLPNIPSWLNNAAQTKVIKKLNVTTQIFQTDFHAIWPVSNRTMIIKSHYWQNNDLSLEIAIEDMGEIYQKEKEVEKNNIIIKVISAHWLITPLMNNQISIEYQFIADPQGSIPTWLVNRLTLQSIWTTLDNIEQQLPISPWQKQTLPHIKEVNEHCTRCVITNK